MVIIFLSQVVWVRMLMSVFGVSTFAVSIVLSAGVAFIIQLRHQYAAQIEVFREQVEALVRNT